MREKREGERGGGEGRGRERGQKDEKGRGGGKKGNGKKFSLTCTMEFKK